jgi:imidazolonepropionase-like amidohydrolase
MRVATPVFAACTIAFATTLGTVRAQETPVSTVAFTGGRVVTLGETPATVDSVMLVTGGRVVAIGPAGSVPVPAGTPRIDLGGRFVLPGLISTHVHISDVTGPEAQLGVFARYGITTVLSLGGESAPAFRARETQSVASRRRSRLLLAGDIITAATPDAARQQVAQVAASKPDMIKIRVDDNLGTSQKMPPDVFRAVIDEAHRHGLRVAAHVFYLDDAKALVRAGVDMIAHSVRDKDIDAEFIAMMKAANVPYCPTLTRELSTFVYESTPAFFDDPFFKAEADPALVARLKEPARQAAMAQSKSAQAYKAALVVAERNLKAAADAGLLIVMGTDAGPLPERFQGYFEHVELEMMAAAGLSPLQVLRSATVDAARALRLTDTGVLAPGAWADFVVLDRNPLEDIRNTRAIASVWIAGNQVVPKTAEASAPAAGHDKAFWRRIAASQFAVPEGSTLAPLLTELTALLGSPDPELRDDIAYSTMAQWVYRQRIVPVDERRRLMREWTAGLRAGIGENGTNSVFRRSFSALALGLLVILDNEAPFLERAEFDQLLAAALSYLQEERDVRGFDPEMGWMHSVAHTADLLKFLGRSRHLQPEQQRTILAGMTAKLRRVESPLVDGEDDRLARAVLSIAARPDFDEAGFAAWLKTMAPPERTVAPTAGQRASDLNVRHLLVSSFAVISADPREASSLARARELLLTQLRGR